MSTVYEAKLMFGVEVKSEDCDDSLLDKIEHLRGGDPVIAEHGDTMFVGMLIDEMDIGYPDAGISMMEFIPSNYEDELKEIFKEYDLTPKYMIVGQSF
jgi:hypothetical protein